MKLQYKFAFLTFLVGTVLLVTTLWFFHHIFLKTSTKTLAQSTRVLAEHGSMIVETLLKEKANTLQALAMTPQVTHALLDSNDAFDQQTEESRLSTLNSREQQWSQAKEGDPLLQEILNNPTAQFLIRQQERRPAAYGEIFLINRFGATVAASRRLTNYDHSRKYWFVGGYNNGQGRIFIDDRGYDSSVGGVVLGVVVPVRSHDQVIGLLKANLHVNQLLGQIDRDTRTLHPEWQDSLQMSVVRSNGAIIFQNGKQPLTASLAPEVAAHLKGQTSGSMHQMHEGESIVLGFCPILMEDDSQLYSFGGRVSGKDHRQGNSGETWFVVVQRKATGVLEGETLSWLMGLGLLMSIVLAILSLILGRWVSLPVARLAKASSQLGSGTFPAPLPVAGNDELAMLAHAFNHMVNRLQTSMTSRDELAKEVAARQQIEDSLRSLQARQEEMINTVDGILWEADPNTFCFTFVSRQAESLLGYPVRQWLEEANFWPRHIHPDDQHWAVDYCLQQTRQALNHVFEYRMIAANGQTVWLRDVVVVVSEGSEVKAMRGLMVDITQRKMAEEKLFHAQQMLQWVMDAVPQAIYWKDLHTSYMGCNQVYADAMGLANRAAIAGLNDFDLPWSTAQAQVFLKREKRVMESEQALTNLVEERIFQDGTTLWTETSIIPLKDSSGVVIGVLVAYSDITRRREAEAKLQESEERYRSLVENTTDGYWIWQMNSNRLLFSNNRLCTMLGCQQTSLEEIDPWEMFDSEERYTIRQRIQEWWANDRVESHRQVVPLRRQDGSTIRVEVTSTKIIFHGQLVHQGLVRDITQEERLARQLEHAQKMEAIGTLAGGIAHDFNNVLGVVIGFSELAKMELQGHTKVVPYLDQILAAGLRAREVVAQLLTFSRRQPTEKKPILLDPIVKEAIRFMRATLPTNIEIRLKLHPGHRVVLANATQIHQVLLNLCSNAGQAMAERGGSLNISLQTITLSHTGELPLNLLPGTYSLLQVVDNGPGMDNQIKNRIFDPFFTTKKTGQGTGLGLAVVHGIVTNHGGCVGVESQVGIGSTFSVYLPEVATSPNPESLPVANLVQGGGKHILVVDDEEQLLSAVHGMLTALGYRVTTANHPLQGLELFMADPQAIHLVITDMAMPGMLGTELAERLRQVRNDIPIVVSTGCTNPLEQEGLVIDASYGFLQKPFSVGDLSRILDQLLFQDQRQA
ncbi:MAG: PAS domain S-box protein [Magnetococcales bacterium]|nr:PAS domain S-box protein [Magnetococcales bacterium]NGZ26221.1 PAS domain S-box protein [Magnetococcales bacterium]